MPTVWDAVEAQHRKVALIWWPVTVGARVSFNVPEFWRASNAEDQKLVRSLATPGLLEKVARTYPALWTKLTPPEVHDEAPIAIAKYLVTQEAPDLMMVHISDVDSAQHTHGPRSSEARAAIEHADQQLGDLLATLGRTPAYRDAKIVVLSDHGFAPIDHEIRLGALMVERGLITLGPDNKPVSARAAAIANGGTAYLYLTDPAARPELEAMVASLGPAIGRRYTSDELTAMGGDPKAAFALAGAPGHSFSARLDGPTIATPSSRGHHGFPPSDPAMGASFIAVGPGITPRDLGTVRMVDVAPTIAQWFAASLPDTAGKPIAGL